MNSAIKKTTPEHQTEQVLLINLRTLMHEKSLNEAGLSRETHIPQPTLHKILSGKTSDPRVSTLKLLANYFEVTLDALYAYDVLKTMQPPNVDQGRSIPVISWESCLQSNNPTAQLSPSNWEQWVVVANADNKPSYGLKSKPSMEPRFPKGTTFIIDASVQPVDGDLVVVAYPNTKEATLRELLIDGPNQLLLSLNQNLAPDKLDRSIRILGTVLQSRLAY
jgi:SOS-response transcriptional repressor LexA